MERKKERKKERKTPEANEKMKNELPQVGFEPMHTKVQASAKYPPDETYIYRSL